jgi:predicted ester cyclase
MGGTHQGRDAARAFFDAFFAAFVDLTVDSDRLIVDGATIVQILRIEGTHTGPFHGLPPTHKPFHFTAAVLYDFKNQQIVREQRIYDFTGVLIQIGVLKAKPQ